MKHLVILVILGLSHALDWRTLDQIGTDIRHMRSLRFGSLDPNPNSTITIGNQISDALSQENALWNGTISSGLSATTWLYLLAMTNVTTVTENFIRNAYGPVFADVPIETCNGVSSAPEVILDVNLGFSPNKITYNSTELEWLIPPHPCVLPSLPNGQTEPTFASLRKSTDAYKTFLLQTDQYLECILLVNAYPSYTKAVSCLEDYYYGAQDAGANPQFFDLMANKEDLRRTVVTFTSTSMPGDMTIFTPSSWSDYQYLLGIVRQYKEVARKVRYTTLLIYNALTRNYIRLNHIKTCRNLELIVYQTSEGVSPFWCNYTNCYQDSHNLSLLCNTYPAGHPLAPSTRQICEPQTCGINATFPDPFYCDTNRTCSNGWLCSLIDRHCYKAELVKPTFRRAYNTTVCGYARRLADASAITGNVITAFGGFVNESMFQIQTFWPQNCSIESGLIVNPSIFEDIGPLQIQEICYPIINGTTFYNNTTDCSSLGYTIICLNVTYTFYVDDRPPALVSQTICVNRTGVATQPWQVPHCNPGDAAPIPFLDYIAYSTTGNTGSSSNLPQGFMIMGLAPYMGCSAGSPTCTTMNSTHVCYHGVQDVVRVFNHFFNVSTVKCTNQRVYGNPSNITYNYIDPNASLVPPVPYTKPSDYTNVGYFTMSADAYGLLTPGSATVTGGSIPTTVHSPDHGEFRGYYVLTNLATNTWKLTGRFTFMMQTGNVTVEGNDYFLTLNGTKSFTNCSLPGLVVNNITGQLIYDPSVGPHPNPRFENPNECYFMEITVLATIPMVRSPAPAPRRYKDFWMQGVGPTFSTPNSPPALQPCAAVFLRKVLYVGTSDWLSNTVTDYQLDSAAGVLSYVCLRSLDMSATCSRLGVPLTSTDYDNLLSTVNPPTSSITFAI